MSVTEAPEQITAAVAAPETAEQPDKSHKKRGGRWPGRALLQAPGEAARRALVWAQTHPRAAITLASAATAAGATGLIIAGATGDGPIPGIDAPIPPPMPHP